MSIQICPICEQEYVSQLPEKSAAHMWVRHGAKEEGFRAALDLLLNTKDIYGKSYSKPWHDWLKKNGERLGILPKESNE